MNLMMWALIGILLVVNYNIYKPYIDRTSNGSVVIWYNWKGKRTFKYLYKVK